METNTVPRPAADPDASYEVITSRRGGTGPKQRHLGVLYNNYQEARACGDAETMARLREEIPPLLRDYAETEALTSDRPRWYVATVHAAWEFAKGNPEEALKHDLNAWESERERPSKDRRRWMLGISASNIAEALTRLNQCERALEWAERATQLSPGNPIPRLNFAVASYELGFRDEPNEIINRLHKLAVLDSDTDALAACLTFERKLRVMTDLKSVRQLLRDLSARDRLN